MKFVGVILFALFAAVIAGPVSISDNNVGDIVTVGVNANLELSNKIDQHIISIIIKLLNQQAIVIPDIPERPADRPTPADGHMNAKITKIPDLSQLNITPEMIEKLSKLIQKKQ